VKAPLAGVTVVETASHDCNMALRLSAALAGRIAADLGAEVVKVEPPDGDPVRRMPPFVQGDSALFAFLNAGKRSVVLPHGDEAKAMHALLERADAMIADAAAGGPRARVSVLLSMLGRNAPADVPASEFTVLALGGALNLVGEPDREPLRLGGHQVAYAAGLSAFTGLAAALCGTEPEVVHVSLLENAVWLNWKNVATAEGGGEAPSRAGRASDWPIVRCADGWVALVYRDDDWQVMRELTGNDPRLADPALGTLNARHARAAEIAAIVEEHFAPLTRAQLRQLSLERKLPLGPVLTPEETLQDPQHLARAFFATVRLDARRTVTLPRLPVLWSGNAFIPGAVPALGSGVAGAAS
jgi:crotonobetainyl-CoA:carnitine CoA-transferase CaiB-like acyl-CoA transferase